MAFSQKISFIKYSKNQLNHPIVDKDIAKKKKEEKSSKALVVNGLFVAV